MLYLRPQRVYKPSALSYLGNPSDIADSIIDRYSNKDLYRLRIEIPRGTSITADNSQITCYAHIFDKEDGTELTDLLKGRGFHPTWLLDGKPIDSARISEEGYQLTLETDHLPAIYQAVTLQARDTDILLALTTDEIQKRIYSQLIELGSIPTNLLKTSEKLLNISRLDKIRVEGLEETKQDLAKALASKLATSQQQAVAEAVKQAEELDKKLKVGGRNLFRNKYFIGDLASRYEIPFDALQPREGDNTYTLSLDYKISPEDKASLIRISCWYIKREFGGIVYDSDIKRDGEWHHKEYTIKLDIDPSKYPIYGWFTDYSSSNGRTIEMVAVRNVKLERGTVATDWTPAPEDVAESVSKVNTSLTSLASTLLDPEQGEIHKLTSQLTTSAQQAIAEAVRQAGEMDKKLKVGGRNLIVTSRWKAGYLYGDRDENAYPVGSENYKVLVGYDTFRFDPVYIPTLGEREVTYKLYDNGGSTNGTVQIHAYDKDKKFLWWSVDGWDGTIGHTNAWTLPADTVYIRLGVTNENVRAKVEFGTVVTDWTPAPEDVENTMAMLTNSLSLSNDEIDYLKKAVTSKADRLAVNESFSSMIGRSDKRFKNAFDRIFNIDLQLQGIPRIDVDGSGRIAVSAKSESCPVNHGYNPDDDVNLRSCSNGVSPVNIQLVLRSDFDTLKRQVDNLSARIAQLEAGKNVTPVTDTRLRQTYNLTHSPNATLYPLYGDWILTSDVDDQYISFSGLSAEVGKSIYIQTRRKAYLYANNHSFYGLPGTSSSIAVNQWLAKNTTYRFVRASSDSWLVTASSSPYPWT